MTEDDIKLEQEIEKAYLMMATPTTPTAERRNWQNKMFSLCQKRSRERQVQMECDRIERIRRGR